jgi:hypothetical protein
MKRQRQTYRDEIIASIQDLLLEVNERFEQLKNLE